MPPVYWTVKEAARFASVTPQSVHDAVTAGHLTAYEVNAKGHTQRWLVLDRAEVELWNSRRRRRSSDLAENGSGNK